MKSTRFPLKTPSPMIMVIIMVINSTLSVPCENRSGHATTWRLYSLSLWGFPPRQAKVWIVYSRCQGETFHYKNLFREAIKHTTIYEGHVAKILDYDNRNKIWQEGYSAAYPVYVIQSIIQTIANRNTHFMALFCMDSIIMYDWFTEPTWPLAWIIRLQISR